jgi:PTH1 family peptidyl-tRNA hydrolase
MKIIFGLGNPGLRYEATRHNCGFLTLDTLADDLQTSFDTRQEDNFIAKAAYRGERLILAKPQLFMNRSGYPLVRLCNYYKVDYEDILIILDDLALAPTMLRLRRNGSDGGHKGMQSIIEQTGVSAINRLKIGIGCAPFDAAGYVTGLFSKEETPGFAKAFALAAEIALCWVTDGIDQAMNRYNNTEALTGDLPSK